MVAIRMVKCKNTNYHRTATKATKVLNGIDEIKSRTKALFENRARRDFPNINNCGWLRTIVNAAIYNAETFGEGRFK